jgi:hypothetical protein
MHQNLILDPSPNDGRTAAFEVVAKWYAAHSAVRRLWAISESQRLRVIVMLEPTHDGDEIYPAWLANSHEWARELQLRMDCPVQLEVVDAPSVAEFAVGVDGVLVAEVFWRDSSMQTDDIEWGNSSS